MSRSALESTHPCGPLWRTKSAKDPVLGAVCPSLWRLARRPMYIRGTPSRRYLEADSRKRRAESSHLASVAPPARIWDDLPHDSRTVCRRSSRVRAPHPRKSDPTSDILVVPGGGGISPVLATSGAQSLAPRELSPYGPLLEEKYFLTEQQCRREDRAQKSIRVNFFLRSAAFRGRSQLTRSQPSGDSCSTKSSSRRQV